MADRYQYTESGLDNVWLVVGPGVQFTKAPSGQIVRIKDLEGLHRAIGNTLAKEKKDLTGREVRFLRQEMLLSQASLAKLLGVTEQTVHRWEAGKTDVPKPAEALIRGLYLQQLKEQIAIARGETATGIDVRRSLERLADLENDIDKFEFMKANDHWIWNSLEAA